MGAKIILNKKIIFLFLSLVITFVIVLNGIVAFRKITNKSKATESWTASLFIEPKTINFKTGVREKFNVYIDTANKQPLDGFFLKLKFDPQKIKVTEVIVNPPFEKIIAWANNDNNKGGYFYLSGLLPPNITSPLTAGFFAIGSFYAEGVSRTDKSSIDFDTVDSRFQITNNGYLYNISSKIGTEFCVDSTSSNCPAFVCSKPEPPVIKYPLNNKKTTESKLEVYFEALKQGCFPKQYQASLYEGENLICRTNWMNLDSSGIKLIKPSEFKSKDSDFSQNCQELKLGSKYKVEIKLKYPSQELGQSQVSDAAQTNFTYVNDSVNTYAYYQDNNKFISTFGSTDVKIPDNYPVLSRKNWAPSLLEKYMRMGDGNFLGGDSVGVAIQFCHYSTNWREGYKDFASCALYYYRKLREIALNFNNMKSISIDDMRISVETLERYGVNFSSLKEAAVGLNGKFGGTWYGEDNCPSYANEVNFIITYVGTTNTDHQARFEKTKNCFRHAKIIYGLYPVAFRCLYPSANNNKSDAEEIKNSCDYAKFAKKLLDSGEVAGIEIYDRTLDRTCEDIDRTIATLTSDILKTGDSSLCPSN